MNIKFKKTINEVVNLINGRFKATIVYLDLDLKMKSLISSLKIAITIVTIAIKTFKSSILDSYGYGIPPLSQNLAKKKPNPCLGLGSSISIGLNHFSIQVTNLDKCIITRSLSNKIKSGAIKMKMALMVLLLVGYMANAMDTIDIKVNEDINFEDGFGMLQARPVLQGVQQDVQLLGEYNVNTQNNNVEIKFDKVIYQNQTYTLTEPFTKQARLKNPKNAVLKKDSKIKIAGGSKSEILSILNGSPNGAGGAKGGGIKSNANGDGGSLASKFGDKKSGSGSGGNYGYGSNTSGATRSNTSSPYNYPYSLSDSNNSNNLGSSSTRAVDYGSPTTNSDGSCKSPYIQDNIVGVYTSNNGNCQLLTAPVSAIYLKENQPTCQNKIDYSNKSVEIGQEQYIAMDDNKEYKISQCQYSQPIKLSSEIGKCKAIPNYETNQASVQRQYFYIKENQRINVGTCTPATEEIRMQDDVNACEYRLDFIDKVAIKQTQFFYMSDNKRYDVGECVDKKDQKFKYAMFETPSGCNFTTLGNGVKLYETKLVFNDLQRSLHDATECRIIDTNGLEVLEEFAGYSYKDTSKQALRKINQYFIGEGNQKIYLTKDVETNKSYPYQTEPCQWVNDDTNMVSSIKIASFFEDTDENKKIYAQTCDDPTNLNETKIGYVRMGYDNKVVEIFENKTLILDGDKYKIYGTDFYIENAPITARNIKDQVYTTRNDNCWDPVKNNWYNYSEENHAGMFLKHEYFNEGYDVNISRCYIGTLPNSGTNQFIEKIDEEQSFLRGDGTRLKVYTGVFKYYAK